MPKRHGGGRPREGEEVKRAPLNLRTSPELREKIEQAADANGYSLTQEVERRLLSSFNEDQWMGGAHIRGFVKMLGATIDRIETQTGKRWIDDLETWVAVQEAAKRLLRWDRPPPTEREEQLHEAERKWHEAADRARRVKQELDAHRGIDPNPDPVSAALGLTGGTRMLQWTDEDREHEQELVAALERAREEDHAASDEMMALLTPGAELWRRAKAMGESEAEGWFALLGPKPRRP